MGSPKAPLTIVEFSDFECSYCRRFHDQVLNQLKQHYVSTGLVRFVHKDLMPHSLIVPADQMPFTGLTLCRSIRHDHPKSIGASRIDGFGFHQQPVRVA